MYLPDLPKMPDQDYERQLRQICAVPAMAEVGSTPEPPVDLTVFICFTNRSGSNYLASLLASIGEFPAGREMFNVKAVTHACRKHGITSLDAYCRRQMQQQAHKRRFAAKVGLAQLLTLERGGCWQNQAADGEMACPSRSDPNRQRFRRSRSSLRGCRRDESGEQSGACRIERIPSMG
jgi:hypothetical protein